MLKIDLHTHSSASPDGGITAEQYHQALNSGQLDYIAITDHNTIEMAQKLHSELGNRIIVGQEIDTPQGEIIGLFLKQAVPANLPIHEAIRQIRQQKGLVYIPHPFETVRRGLTRESLEAVLDQVDIIEIFNGRALFQNKGPMAATFARINNIPAAAASDAHGYSALATTYSHINKQPTASNLADQLRTAHFTTKRPPLMSLLYPKINRLKKRLA